MMAARDYDVSMYTQDGNNLEDFTYEDFKEKFFNDEILKRKIENEEIITYFLRTLRAKLSSSDRSMLSTYFIKKMPDENSYTFTLVYFSPFNVKTQVPSSDVNEFYSVFNYFNNLEYFRALYGNPDLNIEFTGIMITQNKLASAAHATFKSYKEFYKLQHFTESEIEIDPTVHVYGAVSYEIMSLENRRLLFTQDSSQQNQEPNLPRIKESQLLRVLSNEAVVKYIGALPGDVVKIVNETFVPGNMVESEILYRKVKNATEKQKSKKTTARNKPK